MKNIPYIKISPSYVVATLIAGLLSVNTSASANTLLNQLANSELKRQAERIKQKEAEYAKERVQLEHASANIEKNLPLGESPCFVINQVHLEQPNQYSKLFENTLNPLKKGEYAIVGKCLGNQGLKFAQKILQSELIKQGYITSHVTLKAQDLRKGKIVFTLYPGKVSQLRHSEDNPDAVNTFNAVVSRPGDILNLRDIETSLENLRVPSSVVANIDIEPAKDTNRSDVDQFGYSDLVIKYKKNRPLRITGSIDDSGSRTTGKYQGSLGLVLDTPLAANDVLRLDYGKAIDAWNDTGLGASNQSVYANYIIPLRSWQLSLSYNEYNYYQMLLGLNKNLKYQGKSKNGTVKLSKLLYRDGESRTNVFASAYYKQSKNYVDALEILIQRRITAGWSLGLEHQRQLSHGMLNLGLGYRRGTNAFGANDSPESKVGLAKSHPEIITASVSYTQPIQLLKQPLQYRAAITGQMASGRQISQDSFSIGGRYSVRGFSGEQSLSGDNGGMLQQDMTWWIPSTQHQVYLGLDNGWVGGESAQSFTKKHLMGTVAGLRLNTQYANLDAFIGKGLIAPAQVDKKVTAGFKLHFNY